LADDDVVGEDVIADDEEAEVVEEGEDDEGGDVASEPPSSEEALSTADSEVEGEEELGPSPDADFVVIFNNKKTAGTTDLVAGEVTTALIGLSNTGSKDFIITAIEGSLRFPQDFSYHIQNFSANYYEQYVSPETDASFVYAFQPSEMFTSRSFGFVISVYYKDIDDKDFLSAVFNDTVNIVEIEEGFDGETFFMYIFMISGLCLLMFIAHYVYTTVWGKGGSVAKKPQVERGTQGKDEVDYSWLPAGTIPTPKKSPKPRASPKPGTPKSESSPRKRRPQPS
jgi:translocon-associated protein subunit alpha